MLEFFLIILIISSIAAGLALLLVLCQRYIVNYGLCRIVINEEKELAVEGGKPLLSILRDRKIFIPSACGGRGTCGVCKVKVLQGGGPILPTETPFLTKQEQTDRVRLSCQVKVRSDIRIELPRQLLSVQEFVCICSQIEDLTYDMKRFRFELKSPQTIEFTAGQYVQLLCPRYKGSSEEVYRAYSIASDPQQKTQIDLIIRRVPNGICTTWCFDVLREGDPVQLNGPYGEFCLSRTDAPAVFIAGGSGMAPFVSILHSMRNARCRRSVHYFFGGNTVRDLCLLEQMKEFEHDLEHFSFIPVVAKPSEGENWDGQTGLVTHAVQKSFKDLSAYEGYLCGSPGMIDASIKVLTELGMPADKIYYDKFA
ncbi:MAG: 2Fe-2S iron-sulfur cluster binding domain-containing protein [Phycisphaerae bacterium]|nr:2Fe-2S iron-sulfur cluster binding domain-containing protein [Phycisphaerae bacterium]